jgi:hypothetical protein
MTALRAEQERLVSMLSEAAVASLSPVITVLYCKRGGAWKWPMALISITLFIVGLFCSSWFLIAGAYWLSALSAVGTGCVVFLLRILWKDL